MGNVVWPNGSKTQPPLSPVDGTEYGAPRPDGRTHRGADFGTTFSNVCAVEAGTVVSAGWGPWSAGGNAVWIDHDGGYRSRSLHLSSVAVSAGQRVTAGQKIGVMGNTGSASMGTHLHFEIDPTHGDSDANNVSPIVFLTPRVNDTTPPAPNPTKKDSDMRVIRWNNLHIFTIGQEYIKYETDGPKADTMAQLLNGSAIINVDNNGFNAIQKSLNIPWSAVDAVLGHRAFNLEGQRVTGPDGDTWSRVLEIRAKQG